jgi:hypothetical protein
MRSQAQELCDRFDYPKELSEILDEVVDLAGSHLGNVQSIILSPSTSTGDFLWKRTDSGTHLMSDVDGFIFVEGAPRDLSGFQKALNVLTRGVGGPEFHLDLSISSAKSIDQLPQTYQFVETGLAGFVLFGESPLERFPSKFDPRASRQAFLLNLFKPLRHEFLLASQDGLAQAAARLILDIPTLAASERGECIAGHRARARWFLDERPGILGTSDLIIEAVEAAEAARQAPPGNLAVLRAVVYPAILEAASLLDGRGPVPENPDKETVMRLAAWLPPRSVRRVLGELRTTLRRPTQRTADLRWLRNRKEALAGAALLGAFSHLARGANGTPPSGIGLCLLEFSRRPSTHLASLQEDERDFMPSICKVYSEGLLEIYPSLADAPQ